MLYNVHEGAFVCICSNIFKNFSFVLAPSCSHRPLPLPLLRLGTSTARTTHQRIWFWQCHLRVLTKAFHVVCEFTWWIPGASWGLRWFVHGVLGVLLEFMKRDPSRKSTHKEHCTARQANKIRLRFKTMWRRLIMGDHYHGETSDLRQSMSIFMLRNGKQWLSKIICVMGTPNQAAVLNTLKALGCRWTRQEARIRIAFCKLKKKQIIGTQPDEPTEHFGSHVAWYWKTIH